MSQFVGNNHWTETRYAGYSDVAAGREALTGFECQQTERRIHSEKCQRYFHAMLMISKIC